MVNTQALPEEPQEKGVSFDEDGDAWQRREDGLMHMAAGARAAEPEPWSALWAKYGPMSAPVYPPGMEPEGAGGGDRRPGDARQRGLGSLVQGG